MVLWGSPLFFLYGTRDGPPAHLRRSSWELRLVQTAAVTVLVGAIVWVLAETASMSDLPTDSIDIAALWIVLSQTRFGLACLVRLGLIMLALVTALSLRRARLLWTLEAALGCAITLSFAWTGHGASDMGRTAGIQLGADLLHLLSAGVWVGALVPLTVLVIRARRSPRLADVQNLRFALQAFSSIGVWVVAVLVLSGIINSLSLMDRQDWRMSLTTLYARVLFVKLTLFFAMLGLATFNRYRAVPLLEIGLERGTASTGSLSRIRLSLIFETLLAALVLLTVSWLGTLAPPMSQA